MSDDSTFATQDASAGWTKVGDEEQDNAPLSMLLRTLHNQVGLDSKQANTHVCLTVKARKLEGDGKRAPVDIMIALDLSGSMRGNKLSLCKVTLEQLLRYLTSEDRFGLVTYASDSRLDFPPQKMTKENKIKALQQIRSLRASGTTNISSAIGLAFQELRALTLPNEVRTIFLLTDGHANQGIFDYAGLVEFTKNCASGAPISVEGLSLDNEKEPAERNDKETPPDSKAPTEIWTGASPPISLHCFGYGTDHNADLLADMAKAGSGGYYFVENDSNVAGAFGDALGGIMSVVAQNATLTIKLHPQAEALGAKIIKVHHDQATRRENGSHTVLLNDFYAEETRDVLVEIQLAVPTSELETEANPIQHVVASLAYSDTVLKTLIQGQEQTASILRPPGAHVSNEDGYVAAQRIRVFTAESLQRAQDLANRGDLAAARAGLQQMRADIQGSAPAVRATLLVQQLQMDLNFVEEGMASSSVYESRGSKRAAYKQQTHARQRCTESTVQQQQGSSYATSSKAKFMRTMNESDK